MGSRNDRKSNEEFARLLLSRRQQGNCPLVCGGGSPEGSMKGEYPTRKLDTLITNQIRAHAIGKVSALCVI